MVAVRSKKQAVYRLAIQVVDDALGTDWGVDLDDRMVFHVVSLQVLDADDLGSFDETFFKQAHQLQA